MTAATMIINTWMCYPWQTNDKLKVQKTSGEERRGEELNV